MFHVEQFADVIVIGAGHAGCEAALASARLGARTALVTLDATKIAVMSCNPSIGGVGKGQLVKEIDALGGEMGIVADLTGIQFKRLNTRKGSAVQSTRCQSDKGLYAREMQSRVALQPGLETIEGEIKSIVVEEGRIIGVILREKTGGDREIRAKAIVITAGTFMAAVMHCGEKLSEGGRFGENSSVGLSSSLADLGFKILRLKTGTPPRLLRNSLDFSKMSLQEGDDPPRKFSFSDTKIALPQVPCYLGATNLDVHGAIRSNLHRSPLYSGKILGVGPRYCPSIEDKVVKFPDKQMHHLFFEPEALDSDWIYPNGISTSLPPDVQEQFVRKISGCEEAQFARYGYAVEYDCIDPTSLDQRLGSKSIKGLFFAGQVNGTSGYEEAAAQGLIAGINAGLEVLGREPFILSRSESYIGVMVEDLTSVGVTEPYRMFTSRCEFRLSIREDNSDLRLTPYAHRLGLVSEERYQESLRKKAVIEKTRSYFTSTYIKPNEKINDYLATCKTSTMLSSVSVMQLMKRPELGLDDISRILELNSGDLEKMFHVEQNPEICETMEIEFKYEGYINLQRQEIARLHSLRGVKIPEDFDFLGAKGLSIEVREKLSKFRPATIEMAAKIPGVTPAALTNILFGLRGR